MVCTTSLYQSEQNIPTSNDEINSTLKSVREMTNRNWQVIERTRVIKRWFKKDLEFKTYDVYLEVGGCLPFQVINFYKDGGIGSVFYGGVSAATVINYFYGILAGVHQGKGNEKHD